MNFTIVSLTFRSLLGRKRSLLLIPLPLILIALTWLGRATAEYASDWQKPVIIGIGFAVVVPLLALIVGSSVLGSEIDDGTIVHTLTKPLTRREIIFAKYAVAAVVTAVVSGLTMAICGLIAGSGRIFAHAQGTFDSSGYGTVQAGNGAVITGPPGAGYIALTPAHLSAGRFAFALAVGAIVASLCYCALFLALSVVSRRSVLIGLIYILIWEGLLGNLLTGTRSLSIEQFAISASAHVAHTPFYSATLSSPVTIVMSLVFLVGGLWIAIDRLRSFAVKGETA